MEIDTNDGVEITIKDIHSGDGYAYAKSDLIGKKFKAFLTTTSAGAEGWYMIAGNFIDVTGHDEIDNAGKEQPIVISMARYTV